MHIEYHKWWSPNLNRHMELKVFGHSGKPILIFPSSGGSFYEYEDFGMINACADFINRGAVQFICVDSVDQEAFLNLNIAPAYAEQRHRQFEEYILQEVTPFIRNKTGYHKFFTSGCSMGGFHAINALLKQPDVFDGAISLSGVFAISSVFRYNASELYYNSPVHYLGNINDERILNLLRQSTIIVCVGQGRWEEDSIRDARDLQYLMGCKGIPAQFEYWGHDVDHDWPWWRIQMPYFLHKLGF